jgi:hypothetical protein
LDNSLFCHPSTYNCLNIEQLCNFFCLFSSSLQLIQTKPHWLWVASHKGQSHCLIPASNLKCLLLDKALMQSSNRWDEANGFLLYQKCFFVVKCAKWNAMQDFMWGKNNIAAIPNVISHRGHQ